MTKRMLIDASHAEETRVVVLDGNRLEEFDLEAATRKPLKGNIYLAKVVRVEPSLQAAFVEYGGNRHGFLAFSEIHPDYYQIPVADRQRLLQMQAEEAREAEEAEDDPLPESPMDRAAEEEVAGRDGADDAGAVTVLEDGAVVADSAGDSEDGAAEPARIIDIVVEAAAVVDAIAVAPAAPPAAGSEASAAPMADAGAAAAPEGPVAAGADAGPEASGFDAAPAEALEPGDAGAPPAGDAPPAAALETAEPNAAETAAPDARGPSGTVEPDAAGALAAPGASGSAEAPEPDAGGAPGAVDAAPDAEDAPPARTHGEPRQSRRRGRRDDRSSHRRGEDGESRSSRSARGDAEAQDEESRGEIEEEAPPETIGGEGPEDGEGGREERRIPPRFLRHYKIQEVIKRRQIMLVQVVKEERGTKGAALTSYISLAGRFSVLMPNSPRGGGVSRKITSAADRKRLREAIDELGLPDGMSLIVRTAGAQRPKPEIKRDCEYLLRLWDNIRERTLASTAPALIYEEADLIKRAIRDVFSRDVEEIVVEGEDAYQEAREFMRMLMPQHVKKIQYARDGGLFARAQVEQQLDAMHNPTVQLKSGGYIVINQTEALVAIDVNSGRATRERHIEDTALRTNLEAADEIARQLRLRDLAGLIVIDFIDMESSKHDGMVERRLKDALRHDRARIQVGRISHFGLLEMSRQRLRPSLAETSFVTCPHCQGRGTVRSIESSALAVLRAIEEEGAKRRSAEIAVHCCSSVALYLLNRKRDRLTQLEEHFGMSVVFEPDESLAGPQQRIERLRAAEPSSHRALPPPSQAALRMDYAPEPEPEEEDEAEDEADSAAEAGAEEEAEPAVAREGETQAEAEARAEAEGGKRRRRRRRRRGAKPEGAPGAEAAAEANGEEGAEEGDEDAAEEEAPEMAAAEDAPAAEAREGEAAPGDMAAEAAGEPRSGSRRRRGRRGSGPRAEGTPAAEAPRPVPVSPAAPPRYMGPTPADPFAGHVDDILAAMEAAEAAAEAAAASRQGRISAALEAPPPAAMAPEPASPPEPEAAAPGTREAEPAAASAPEAEPAAASAPEPEATAASAAEPGPAASVPELDPVEAAPVTPVAAEPVADTAPAPQPEPVAAAPAEPQPAAPAAAEPVQGPAVQPKLLDEAPPATQRRAGWWRR